MGGGVGGVGGEDRTRELVTCGGPARATWNRRDARLRASARRKTHPGTGAAVPTLRSSSRSSTGSPVRADRFRRRRRCSCRGGAHALLAHRLRQALLSTQPRVASPTRADGTARSRLHCFRAVGTVPALAWTRGGSHIPGVQAPRDTLTRTARFPPGDARRGQGGLRRASARVLARPGRPPASGGPWQPTTGPFGPGWRSAPRRSETSVLHPHRHALVTRGGWTEDGARVSVPYVSSSVAEAQLRHQVFRRLPREGLLDEDRSRLLLSGATPASVRAAPALSAGDGRGKPKARTQARHTEPLASGPASGPRSPSSGPAASTGPSRRS